MKLGQIRKLKPLARFGNLLRLDKKDIYQVIWYAFISGIVSLSLPLGIQAIINLIQGGKVNVSWIILVVVVVLGSILMGVLRLMQMRITENIQQKILARAAFEFAFRFPKMKWEAIDSYYPPELSNRFFDSLTVQKGMAKLILDYSAALLTIIFSLILLSVYHPFFILFGVILFVMLYFIFKFSFDYGLETSIKESKFKYKIASWLQEIARNQNTFKNLNVHQYSMNRNDQLVMGYINAREKHFSVLVRQFYQLIGFKAITTAGLLLIGGLLVINQQMNIGQFVAAEIIIIGVISSVEKLILGLESFYDLLTGLEKLGEVTDVELEKPSDKDTDSVPEDFIGLELDKICFHYPNDLNPVLKNISLKIEPKERVLIYGENGSGKSTLLKIMGGWMEPTTGLFYINQHFISKIKPMDYRNKIGIITASQFTFEGSILENITLNDKKVTDEHLKWVIENVQLSSYLKDEPKGMETMLKSEGKGLPSSVIQKIVLARTIIHKPKLLILEEPLDKVDVKQANEIVDFLTHPSHEWTLIVASKNPHWRNKCGREIELNNGIIISDTKN